MAQELDIIDGINDDMSIAQGLLGKPKVPQRRTSFAHAPSLRLVDGSNGLSESSEGDDSKRRRGIQSSNTWTTSSGDILSDQDEVEDRGFFIQEYNRLARKHGVREFSSECESTIDASHPTTRSTWFSRNILRRTSSSHSQNVKPVKPERHIRHRRSISDLSLRLKNKKDSLKDKDLQELVRLCGLSLLYLPAEYAPRSLSVPTCFRATAQYLVQHAPSSRGVFRIPGSHTTVAALYNHYCTLDPDGDVVAGTVRCPTLPVHIKCDVHDVASAFKRFLSGLPGGILGSLSLFYAFVSIQNQLHGDPELTRTKQSKVRARLIALAISTLKSQYRRDLICAVFGLLCMIGRAAETARREDDRGRPLPTSDLMGYGPLGIVFGPLLVGEMLDNYVMRLANPHGGLVILPVSPPKSRKEKISKKSKTTDNRGSDEGTTFNTQVDKLKVANGVTEMLVTHWRDVVRHLKDLKGVNITTGHRTVPVGASKSHFLRPSASESFAIRKPPDWDSGMSPSLPTERSVSPTPISRRIEPHDPKVAERRPSQRKDSLLVMKQRAKHRLTSTQRLSASRSMSVLAPTVEEHPDIGHADPSTPEANSQHRGSEQQDLRDKSHDEELPTAPNRLPPALPPPPLFSQHEMYIIKAPKSREIGEPSERSKTQDQNQPRLAPDSQIALQPSAKLEDNHPEARPADNSARLLPDVLSSIGSSKHPRYTIPRRAVASEPGFSKAVSNGSPLHATQSISDNSKDQRRKHVVSAPNSKDPLGRVSHGEDVASLAELAKAMSTDDSVEDKNQRCSSKKDDGMGPLAKPRENDPRTHNPRNGNTELNLSHDSIRLNKNAIQQSYSMGRSSAIRPVPSAPSQKPENRNTWSPQKSIKREDFPSSITRGSPRGTVKALAARFNSADSNSIFSPSPTKSTASTKSPVKGPLFEERDQSESPKESLVAPYTINPPSPTKSQISTKTEKSNQSLRIQLTPKSQRNPTPVKLTAPKRLVKESPNDSTPLRPVRDSYQDASVRFMQSPTPSKHSSEHSLADCMEQERNYLKSLRSSRRSPDVVATKEGSENVCHFDGSTTLEKGGPENIQSPIKHLLSSSRAPSPILSLVPTRTNSVLHGQIRALQKEVVVKTEEIRHLKQQMGTQTHLDVGTLSEQLREARKEVQIWMSRAEIAEKQIEFMARLSSRVNRQNSGNSTSLTRPDLSDQSSTKISDDLATRSRISHHGMDGTISNQLWSSEESTDTVLRDIAVTGSEYSSWAAKTLKIINYENQNVLNESPYKLHNFRSHV